MPLYSLCGGKQFTHLITSRHLPNFSVHLRSSKSLGVNKLNNATGEVSFMSSWAINAYFCTMQEVLQIIFLLSRCKRAPSPLGPSPTAMRIGSLARGFPTQVCKIEEEKNCFLSKFMNASLTIVRQRFHPEQSRFEDAKYFSFSLSPQLLPNNIKYLFFSNF